MDPENPKLYNRAELAKALGVKPWFIRRLVAQGFPMPLGVSTPAKVHAFLDKLEAEECGTTEHEETSQPVKEGGQ